MTMTSESPNARDVLMTFATEGDPTPKRLEAFVKEHPDLRRELTDLAVELVLEPARVLPPADASTKRAVSSARARFQAATRSAQEASPVPQAVTHLPNVFAGFSGAAFPQLAARLGLTPVFLIKVRDGLIHASGFPVALMKRIAEAVGHDVATIRAILERPGSVPQGMMAKADGKPEAGAKQTFAEAVETSGLSAEQRRELLGMAEAERGSD